MSLNGTLSSPVLTPTGGKGLLGVYTGQPFGPAGSPVITDTLFSSGSVVVSEKYLFAVNSGSHTLSVFLINPSAPLYPKLIGKPVDTQGEFPQSVTYSPQLNTACVVNGGAKNGVACFTVSAEKGLSQLGGLRPLEKLQTKTPPSGPPDTVSEILFNPSSSALLVTIKGNPGPPAVPGYIYAFAVNDGLVSVNPIISSPSALILDYGFNFLGSDTSAIITDATFGASIVNIDSSLTVTETHHIAIPDQAATCWSAYSRHYGTAYAMDVLRTNVTALDPVSGAIKGKIQFQADAGGAYDTVIDRQWMYILSGASSVVVIDLEKSGSGGTAIQQFSIAQEGPAGDWEGMAIYPAHD